MKAEKYFLLPILQITLAVSLLFQLSCGKESSGGRGGIAAAESSSLAGTLVIQLEPKEGSDRSSISGANLQVEGHPEITGKSNSTGKIEVKNLLPGTLNVIVTSTSGSSELHLQGEAAYGVKLDNVVISAGKSNNLGNTKLQATGSFTGTVGFLSSTSIDPEGTLVYIPGTSFSAYTDATGRFALNGLPPGAYQLNFQRDGFAVTKIKDLVIEEGRPTSLGPVTLSLALGPEGAIAVTNGEDVTISGEKQTLITSRSVNLSIRYDSDATLMKIGKDPAFLNQSWEPVSATKSINFDSEGKHSIYVMFADLNGLESSAYSVSFVIDTLPPLLNEISILNGWSQSAPRDVYVSADITDEGSGISHIRFSNTSSTLVGATWQVYSKLNFWTLTAGSGGKTVYAQVKDYAGNVSEIVEDGIVVGAETIIYNTTYYENLTLKKDYGPYAIEGNTTFVGNLTIEPGTVVRIKKGIRVTLKGRLMAEGTAALPIIIANDLNPASGCNTSTDNAFLDMTEAAPGVTEKSRIAHVEFRSMTLLVNGGVFKNSNFSAPGCSGVHGSIVKTGLDKLVLDKANFVRHWKVSVDAGNGLTTIQESTGDFGYFIQQSQGSNTVFRQNSFTVTSSDTLDGVVNISKGVTFVGTNTFTFSHESTSKNLFHNIGNQTIEISGLVVDDTNSTCQNLILDESNGSNVTIGRSTLKCNNMFNRMMSINDTGLIHFDRSIIQARYGLAGLSSSGAINLRFTKNDISVQGTSSYYGRIFSRYVMEYYLGPSNITMQENKITCETSSYCYGFFAAQYPGSFASAVQSMSMNLNIDANYWVGLPMNAGLGSTVIRRSNTAASNFGDSTEHTIYEFDVGYGSTDYIDYTFTVAPYTNLLTAPVVGPLAL